MTPDDIIRAVCIWYRIDEDKLLAHDRDRTAVIPRWIAMHLMADKCALPHKAIGPILNRHHSVVTYGIDQVRWKIDHDPAIDDGVEKIGYLLKAMDLARLKDEVHKLMMETL